MICENVKSLLNKLFITFMIHDTYDALIIIMKNLDVNCNTQGRIYMKD